MNRTTQNVFFVCILVLLVGIQAFFLSPSAARLFSFSSNDASLAISKNDSAVPALIDPVPLVLPSPASDYAAIRVKGAPFTVEIKRTAAARERGLSGRASLDPGTGMLFVFDSSDRYGMWMKDMQFAIDIVWMDGRGVVTHIARRVSPESYPAVFSPVIPSVYVLELPSGSTETMHLVVGDRVGLGTFKK